MMVKDSHEERECNLGANKAVPVQRVNEIISSQEWEADSGDLDIFLADAHAYEDDGNALDRICNQELLACE